MTEEAAKIKEKWHQTVLERSVMFNYKIYIVGTIILTGIAIGSFYNFLFFHTIAEIFSIVIAFAIFVVSWNTRYFFTNNYLLFLGIGYLFVAILDLTHTLAYKGMNIFHGYGANLPTQLWIGTRYLESISLSSRVSIRFKK